MTPSVEVLVEQRLIVFAVAALIATAISLLAWKNDFYRISPTLSTVQSSAPTWQQVLGAFGLFIATELVVVPFAYFIWASIQQGALVTPSTVHIDQQAQGWLNVGAMIFTTCTLLTYFFVSLDPLQRRTIWGSTALAPHPKRQVIFNYLLGAMTWLIVYPWIIALTELIGVALEFTYQGPHIDQVAVKHLRNAMEYPWLFWISAVCIVGIVPCLEELLFRGFLQTWLKSHYGRVKAILLTSVIFAIFHYSSTQGIENVELLLSLFFLSCYLGFIRERQNSLWASIGLHSTFNFVSLMMIVLT